MKNSSENEKLYLLWTNDNYVTAEKMVFMYAINSLSQGWWQQVTIIIWGATAKLVSENDKIQQLIKRAQAAGVHISACRACAEQLNVIDSLGKLNIELIHWGAPLTQILKNREALLTV